jgi:hypothetical protein
MTKNNWFTTNINNRTPTNICDFKITINPYKFELSDFHLNATRVAYELTDSYNKLYIGYSGGLDSEYVLKTFHKQNLPITPIIIDTPYNKFENKWAFNYCKEINVKPEVLTFTENEIVDKLKEKTIDRGFYSLLGGLPLILCDEVNKIGGSLLTGYGDPFTVIPGHQSYSPISTKLEFSEWDYYLDAYDSSHPSGFFTYDLGLLYSLINQINYSCHAQKAKYILYQLPERIKMFWKKEFYTIFREMKTKIDVQYNYYIEKSVLSKDLNKYIKS